MGQNARAQRGPRKCRVKSTCVENRVSGEKFCQTFFLFKPRRPDNLIAIRARMVHFDIHAIILTNVKLVISFQLENFLITLHIYEKPMLIISGKSLLLSLVEKR